MKNISTGTGLCVLGLCLAFYPIIDRVMPRAEAGATHVAAVVAAATAQVPPEPTIVWYSVVPAYAGGTSGLDLKDVFRVWSDGRMETTRGRLEIDLVGGTYCYTWKIRGGTTSNSPPLCSPRVTVSDPAQGYTYRSDINFDSKVDGSDLAQVLNDWGNAPRQDIPPSTCPLNLINP
jgi:hypothetical protein